VVPLRERPGFGTIANLIVIVYVPDITTYVLVVPSDPRLIILYIVSGVVVIGIGSALHHSTNLGPGPRDGLMTSPHRHLGVSLAYVCLTLEATVIVVGWLVGGTVCVGTAFFAATIGFSIGASPNVMERTVQRFQS
jgi:uncharacterized membrane protein YczE